MCRVHGTLNPNTHIQRIHVRNKNHQFNFFIVIGCEKCKTDTGLSCSNEELFYSTASTWLASTSKVSCTTSLLSIQTSRWQHTADIVATDGVVWTGCGRVGRGRETGQENDDSRDLMFAWRNVIVRHSSVFCCRCKFSWSHRSWLENEWNWSASSIVSRNYAYTRPWTADYRRNVSDGMPDLFSYILPC